MIDSEPKSRITINGNRFCIGIMNVSYARDQRLFCCSCFRFELNNLYHICNLDEDIFQVKISKLNNRFTVMNGKSPNVLF